MTDVLDTRGQRLESVFRRISAERMTDVPIVNDRLEVQWLEGQPDGDALLGVLITPWFMSLMRLPNHDDEWQQVRVGDEIVHHYPSGRYRFLMNEEAQFGWYQSCSLFSPVLEFADQDAALETARHVLTALYDDEHQDPGDVDSAAITERWLGQQSSQSHVDDNAAVDSDDVDDAPKAAQSVQIDRRAFLTGGKGSTSHGSVDQQPISKGGAR